MISNFKKGLTSLMSLTTQLLLVKSARFAQLWFVARNGRILGRTNVLFCSKLCIAFHPFPSNHTQWIAIKPCLEADWILCKPNLLFKLRGGELNFMEYIFFPRCSILLIYTKISWKNFLSPLSHCSRLYQNLASSIKTAELMDYGIAVSGPMIVWCYI